MFEYFKNIKKDRHVLQMLVIRDVFSKYRKSILGVAWSMITPLSMVGVIGLVYSVVFGIPLISFVPYLFSGLTPWLFISNVIESGTNSYIIAEGFITQTKIHIEVFPLRMALGAFINYLFMSIAFFFVYGLIKPDAFNWNMLLYIPSSLIVFVFCWGMANIVSLINLYIRDYAYLQSILLQILFYITPLIYLPEVMDKRGFSGIYKLNPLYYMTDIIRQSMLGATEIKIFMWIISIIIAFNVFIVGIVLTKKIGRNIVYRF
jgi:O-antigen export system ATP-binding protein rfbA